MIRDKLHGSALIYLMASLLLAPSKAKSQSDAQTNKSSLTDLPILSAENRNLATASSAARPNWQAVGSETLEMYRGGFTTPAGLQLAFGIERLVTINGAVVAHTTWQIGDIKATTGDLDSAASVSLATGKIIQNGPGNVFTGSLDHIVAGTLVQNSLNDQTIRSQTIISSTVNSLSLLKDLNFQATVRDAAISAIGSK